MKNFRSSKNLKIIDTNAKQQSQLRLKIKYLQQQIQMLQKSSLNILIPLSQHDIKPTTNYQAIINKLKTQILNLQQEVQRSKTTIKKIENEKQMQKISFQNQINKLKEDIRELQQQNEQLQEQNNLLCEKLTNEQDRRKQKQKQLIELKVENKFVKQDLSNQRKRKEVVQKKFQELLSLVLAVNFNSRIYKSKQIKITAIQTKQLKNLKAYIEELQQKIKELLSSKQQKIHFGVKKQNIGEEIVRLKHNIDLQLGLQINQQTTKSFLTAYNQTNHKFHELISQCKLSNK